MKYLNILYQITIREIKVKFKGSILGFLWPILTPLVLLGIYTIIFSQVFELKWKISSDSEMSFAIFLFSGLVLLNFFNDVISRAPSLIASQSNLVKKISFPLELLPLSTVLVSLFQLVINILILFLFIIIESNLNFSIIFLPLILISLVLFATGFSFIISALGVFIRDLANVIPIICTLLLFLSPIFYPLSAVPENLRFIIMLNPLSMIIEQMRDILILGIHPNLSVTTIYFSSSVILCYLGYRFFMKTKKGFSDVI